MQVEKILKNGFQEDFKFDVAHKEAMAVMKDTLDEGKIEEALDHINNMMLASMMKVVNTIEITKHVYKFGKQMPVSKHKSEVRKYCLQFEDNERLLGSLKLQNQQLRNQTSEMKSKLSMKDNEIKELKMRVDSLDKQFKRSNKNSKKSQMNSDFDLILSENKDLRIKQIEFDELTSKMKQEEERLNAIIEKIQKELKDATEKKETSEIEVQVSFDAIDIEDLVQNMIEEKEKECIFFEETKIEESEMKKEEIQQPEINEQVVKLYRVPMDYFQASCWIINIHLHPISYEVPKCFSEEGYTNMQNKWIRQVSHVKCDLIAKFIWQNHITPSMPLMFSSNMKMQIEIHDFLQTPWRDFVTDDEYKEIPLQEVLKWICDVLHVCENETNTLWWHKNNAQVTLNEVVRIVSQK